MTELTQEQVRIQEATREFAEKEVKPIAGKMDRDYGQIPLDLIGKMGQMGLFGVSLPEEYGGLGLDTVSLCLVTEELSRASLSVGSIIHRNSICGHILGKFGTPHQKLKFLNGMASGKLQAASAATEPEAGSDAANIKTFAKLDGTAYSISGTKQWCTNADRADVIFLYARTSKEHKHRGISLFMVEKPAGGFDVPGLAGTHIPTAGYRGMNSYSLYLDGLRVPREMLLGEVEGQAFKQLMSGYETGRITFASRCIGLAQAAYESARAYAMQRVQFDKPIAQFQAVRMRLADMATNIEAARQLTLHAARRFDAGGRADLEAGMAKLFASEMAHKVAWEALYIHGGNGYALDTDVNRYWRDAGLLPIGEGTSDIQREVIARSILGERS